MSGTSDNKGEDGKYLVKKEEKTYPNEDLIYKVVDCDDNKLPSCPFFKLRDLHRISTHALYTLILTRFHHFWH